MYIRSLNLVNFRNYEKLDFYPSSEMNLLVGPNAQGKSAVLESIYFLATSKSHRTSRDNDLIKLGENVTRVCAEVKRSVRNDVTLEIAFGRTEKKTLKIDGVKHQKLGDIAGQLNAIIFSNSDIDMVRGEPSKRRRFLNLEISQVSPQYVFALGRFKKVLEQRNNLLKNIKNGRARADALMAWDTQLVTYGSVLFIKRAKFIKTLARAAEDVFNSLTGKLENISIFYKPSLEVDESDSEENIKERFFNELSLRRDNDISMGTTTKGPHRDDITLQVNGLSAKEFASQGQQRTVAISLKLAEIELMRQYTSESPVVLLDDVMAELDEARRLHILELTAGKCQTFITTTHINELDSGFISDANVFEVKFGKVTSK